MNNDDVLVIDFGFLLIVFGDFFPPKPHSRNWTPVTFSVISGNSGLPEPEPEIAGTRIVGFCFFRVIFGF